MPYRDPKCVFVASNFGQANVVAGWLQGHGIPAEVMNRETMGGFYYPLLAGVTGVEVWVMDPEQTAEAIQLLGDHALELVTQKPTGPPVEVICEECGQTSTFPAQQRGSVQTCPYCSAYLDVEPADGTDQSPGPTDPEAGDDEGPGSDAITDQGPWGMTKP
jgi:hypothetical protein